MTQGEEPVPLSGWACAVNIFFFLSGWIGSFGDSQVFAVTRDKVTCIKYMRMSAQLYTHSTLLFHYVPFFIYYLPSLMGMSLLLGGTLLQGLILWLMLLGIRLAGEALQLLIFDHTGKVLCRSMIFSWIDPTAYSPDDGKRINTWINAGPLLSSTARSEPFHLYRIG